MSMKEFVAFVDTTYIKTIEKQLLVKYLSVKESHRTSKTAKYILLLMAFCTSEFTCTIAVMISMRKAPLLDSEGLVLKWCRRAFGLAIETPE